MKLTIITLCIFLIQLSSCKVQQDNSNRLTFEIKGNYNSLEIKDIISNPKLVRDYSNSYYIIYVKNVSKQNIQLPVYDNTIYHPESVTQFNDANIFTGLQIASGTKGKLFNLKPNTEKYFISEFHLNKNTAFVTLRMTYFYKDIIFHEELNLKVKDRVVISTSQVRTDITKD